MSLAYVSYPEASAAVVVPFSRPKEATSSAPWTALLVLDARIAVADNCVSAIEPSRRGREARRCLSALADVRSGLEGLFSAIVANEKDSSADVAAARAYAAAVCSWCIDVASSLRDMASADEYGWPTVRQHAAEDSSARVRGTILPLFAELAAPMRKAALRLHADVVLLNWSVRG